MADIASLVIQLVREAWNIAEKSVELERTAQNLETMDDELRPTWLEEIKELARKMDLPDHEIESLERNMTEMRETLVKYSKINCCCKYCHAPCYKEKLDKAKKSIEDFISFRLTLKTGNTVMDIRHDQISSSVHTDDTTRILQPTANIDHETLILPKLVEVNLSLIKKLKESALMKDDGDQVLNLNGFSGTGKTSLAHQLLHDQQVRGWFSDNVAFLSVGSKIVGGQLGSELREKWNDRKGLLVVDDVEPGSEDLFEQCLRQLPTNSKILVISRVALRGLGSPVVMTPLQKEDAVTLLRHYVRPIGTVSSDLPNHPILLQVAELCGGFPMAIRMIGQDLRGKQIEFWHQYLRKWQGHSILDTHSKLLDRLNKSLKVSQEYKAIREFFMDLGLFPKQERIPVSALLDMWVELYDQDEDGIDAMTFVHRLTDMNLADRVLQTRIIGSSDEENEVDNQFLTQHNILRDLANKHSREQAGKSKMKRLIIEINGNNPRPECLPQQPQRVINACLASLKASIKRRVAARILSITTDQNVTPEGLRYIHPAKAEVLVLNLHTHELRLPEVIKEMKNLKVLIVTNYGSRSAQFENFELLGFLKTLKRIRLQHATLPCVWKLQNLRKLSLYRCEVMTALGNSFMEFSEAMPKLAEFKIEDSTDLVMLPAGLCNFVNLKKLSITKCRRFTTLPQEIRKLRNLELLRINFCALFEELPESITELQSLTVLDISHCRTLKKLPDNIGQLQNLTDLYMSDCLSIDDLPASIVNLTRLKRVICDEYTSHKWGVVKASLGFNLEVKTVIGMP